MKEFGRHLGGWLLLGALAVLALDVMSGCKAPEPRAGQAAKPAPVASYADAVARWQAGQQPGSLSEKDLAIMGKAADDLAAAMPSPGLKVGDVAPDFSLPDAEGRTVTLYHELAHGPIVLVFFRGAWCPYCNMHLRVLRDSAPAFRQYGARLLAITPQTPAQSRGQIEKEGLGFEVLSDLDSSAAEAYGLNFDVAPELSALYKARFGLDLADYNGPGRYELPVPAVFVIDRGGIIRAASADTDYKKRMEPAAILHALEEMGGSVR
jgi:peroxiredoxin